MRKALLVGIDHYEQISSLHGCVNDAHSMRASLDRHGDGSVNFDVRLETATGTASAISRGELKDAVEALFADDAEIALLFFAGHGHIESSGGYLCASDCARGDDGLSLTEVLAYANDSAARNKVIILDCCHSGFAGTAVPGTDRAELTEGLTILTASSEEQYSTEENGHGVFTTLVVDALNGGAANLVGKITPGSVYAHIDQSLGPWQQRPLFKTNVRSFVSLRTVQAPIPLGDLQRLTELFPTPGFLFDLDPSFEPESDNPNPDNTERFRVLQRYNKVNLVVPVGTEHMYHAAIHSKACKLTVLGEHYRSLVERRRI